MPLKIFKNKRDLKYFIFNKKKKVIHFKKIKVYTCLMGVFKAIKITGNDKKPKNMEKLLLGLP